MWSSHVLAISEELSGEICNVPNGSSPAAFPGFTYRGASPSEKRGLIFLSFRFLHASYKELEFFRCFLRILGVKTFVQWPSGCAIATLNRPCHFGPPLSSDMARGLL